ncbi:MAG: ATP synthase F1 subunit epsilon [Gemmatimonadota bacterium]|jgi:F-type H+-transporting ATPase subunit epsilon|nr:ATP synthase F1 subunit epsilon [Gemmatimonadota bacterium]MDP6461830.1 ATP synthase F1 subunit epsilon [Gemmatimonadota bacterium]MDP6528345.1 ATP synthase F1 subunit epsilon [Gemmatimonadota bacterium]MDP6802429.1 ATP synthase F1 subunit epsilon [Gemmatimonadota bacterium]MDP7031014.1 ATP synthase F1 subunit epsilon [Gemmatimonadota bacterium]
MTESPLRCSIVTPERAFFDEVVDGVVVPAHDGEVGILPGHASFLARIGIGELRVARGSEVSRWFVEGGFVEVRQNRVTVLTDSASEVDAVDLTGARETVEALRSEEGRGEELADALYRVSVMERVAGRD